MLNIFKSIWEPCPCAQSRFGWQMSNTAKMPETWNPLAKPNPYVYWNNYRGMPIKSLRSFRRQRMVRPSAGQDCPREYKKLKSRQKYQEPEFQDYESYGSQHSYCHFCEPCRYQEWQPLASPQKCRRQQPSPLPRRCYEQEEPAPQRWCCEQEEPVPQRWCYELEEPAPQRWCCEPPPHRRFCCQDNSRSTSQDKDTFEREKRRRKRRSCRRRKCYSSESFGVVTHEVSVQTEGEPPYKPDRIETQEKEMRHRTGDNAIIAEEIKTVPVVPNDGSVPNKSQVQSPISYNSADEPQRVQAQLQEEIDPSSKEVPANLKDIPTNPPSGYSSPSEVKERRVSRTNEKFEDSELKSGKKETQTVLNNANDVSDSQPTPTAVTSIEPVKQHAPKPPLEPSPLPKQEKTPSPLNRIVSGYNPRKNFKDDSKKQTVKPRASRMVENSEGKMVPKPRPSDFSQMSTVHMKVINRREKLSQKAGRKSVHQDAVFQTKISELRLISPVSEEEPKPKPKRKKPKKVAAPPPPNDLVCRMHRPIERPRCDSQVCRPRRGSVCGSGGQNCSLPCTIRCSVSPYPSNVPRATQCDPIYGFGSKPAAYYCHRIPDRINERLGKPMRVGGLRTGKAKAKAKMQRLKAVESMSARRLLRELAVSGGSNSLP